MRQFLFAAKVLVILSLTVFAATSLMAQQPDHVSFKFEGCRNLSDITLPIGGVFVCPDKSPSNPNQDAYTGGELGKGWNELDLVPFRLTTNRKAQSNTPSYNVIVAAGYLTAKNFPGYDVLSAPVVNTLKSDASCSVTADAQSMSGDQQSPFSKDVITAIYRNLHIHQDQGTVCVFDWYQRLAVGSHQNPGASLHSYLFDQGAFQGHDSDIPIMLGAAQGINKTMAAVSSTDHTWSIAIDPIPATVGFPNTCDPNQPKDQKIPVSISWTKIQTDPSTFTITTTIQATNPASRELTLNLTDTIFRGTGDSNPVDIASTPGSGVVIPANTASFTVLTHTVAVGVAGDTFFHDTAIGTFVDTITNVDVGGTVTATASTDVKNGGGADDMATISSTESITGDDLTFSVDSFAPANGAFADGYTPGTPTVGPVKWDSISQDASGSVTFSKTITVGGPTQSSGSFSENATLTGSDFATTGFSVTATGGSAISTDARVTLTITKTVDKPLNQGSQIFTFHVKNASDTEVALASVTFNAGETTNSTTVPDLAPGTYSVSEDAAAGWTTDTDKQASIALPNCSGGVTFNNLRHALPLTVTKTANATFDRAYTWSVSKSVNPEAANAPSGSEVSLDYTVHAAQTGLTDSNWKVAGKITVANPNDWEDFTGVTVADSNQACIVTGGDNVTIPASGSVTLDYSCSFAAAPGDGSNTATATWDPTLMYSDDSTAQGSADYSFGTPSHLADQTVTVSDTFNGGAPTTLDTLTATDAAPFTSATYNYSHKVLAPAGTCSTIHNRVSLGADPLPSAERDVKVCGASDLSVGKTAGTAYARAFNWNIQKSADKTHVDQSGGTTTIHYTIVASETGFVDSGWAVSGTITVTNPNDWEDITVNVTDSNAACAVTGGTGVTVPKKSSVNLSYACALPGAINGTNTAVATWDAAAGSTTDGAAHGSADYAFGNPTSVTNGTITVTDTFNGGTPATLGTLYGSTTLPNSKTFTESRTINIPQSGCINYPNVAAITQTGQHSDVTVRVCGPIASGALTIGFWQNKNGQAIITGCGPATGTCKLTPWLRQFAPFQDLSATATCTQAATYIFNLIKVANASGASMNSMLKAQMLATALDVYFSDPALGGNKIGATNGPIGAITIDLTHIWGNQDSSGGFGGATSMTISQMLAYASSRSNAGGSLWYGNVKTTQEKAKNAFDSINNRTAFTP